MRGEGRGVRGQNRPAVVPSPLPPHPFLVCILFLALSGCGKRPWDEPPPPPWGHFEEFERRYQAGDYQGAVVLSEEHPYKKARERERILFLAGESHFQLGRRYKACMHYLDLLDAYPFSAHCDTVAVRLYAAALAAHEAGSDHVRLPNTHRTVSVRRLLEKSLQASPFGGVSAQARLLLGRIHLAREAYDEAGPLFEDFYANQPHGPWAEEALWSAATAYRRHYGGRDYEAEPVLKAESACLEYIVRFPGGKHRTQVDELLREVRTLRRERLERREWFYAKRGKGYEPAVEFYRAAAEEAGR